MKKSDSQRIKDLETEVEDLKRRIASLESMSRPIVSPWNPPPMVRFSNSSGQEPYPVKRL